MGKLLRGLMLGTITGLLLGFIDTYGYAVTGYTTSELSGIVASIFFFLLYKAVYKETPSVLEHVLGVVAAFGISLSTAITSGMYVTYTMLAEIGDVEELHLPAWTYFSGPLTLNTFSFYLYATAVSASGALIAYAFHRHFIEKERLPYPIGSAISIMVKVGKILTIKKIVIPIAVGASAEFLIILLGNPSLDITPSLQSVVPGAALALSMDLLILLLALLLPLNTSIGVGLGNMLTYWILTPILVGAGLMISVPIMSAGDVAVAAAPLTASIIIGFLVVASAIYVFQSRKSLTATFQFFRLVKYPLKYLLIAVLLITSAIIPVIILMRPAPLYLAIFPAYILLQLFLAIITARVVGEAGTSSQSTLPLATLTIFAAGGRTSIPYIFTDPYTGVPMPQFVTGAAMNIIKAGKKLDVDPEPVMSWMMIFMLIGAPITLIYGHILLSAFGTGSPRLNLLRWVPVVTWMDAIYRGDLSSFNMFAILLGVIAAAAVFIILKAFRISGISLFAFLIGITLTPDVGLLFLIAALIKYTAYRIGTDVYEGLVTYSSLLLAGAGVGIAITVLLALGGVI